MGAGEIRKIEEQNNESWGWENSDIQKPESRERRGWCAASALIVLNYSSDSKVKEKLEHFFLVSIQHLGRNVKQGSLMFGASVCWTGKPAIATFNHWVCDFQPKSSRSNCSLFIRQSCMQVSGCIMHANVMHTHTDLVQAIRDFISHLPLISWLLHLPFNVDRVKIFHPSPSLHLSLFSHLSAKIVSQSVPICQIWALLFKFHFVTNSYVKNRGIKILFSCGLLKCS